MRYLCDNHFTDIGNMVYLGVAPHSCGGPGFTLIRLQALGAKAGIAAIRNANTL